MVTTRSTIWFITRQSQKSSVFSSELILESNRVLGGGANAADIFIQVGRCLPSDIRSQICQIFYPHSSLHYGARRRLWPLAPILLSPRLSAPQDCRLGRSVLSGIHRSQVGTQVPIRVGVTLSEYFATVSLCKASRLGMQPDKRAVPKRKITQCKWSPLENSPGDWWRICKCRWPRQVRRSS